MDFEHCVHKLSVDFSRYGVLILSPLSSFGSYRPSLIALKEMHTTRVIVLGMTDVTLGLQTNNFDLNVHRRD